MDVKVLASHIGVLVSEEERVFSSSYFNIWKVSWEVSVIKATVLKMFPRYYLADGRHQQYEWYAKTF